MNRSFEQLKNELVRGVGPLLPDVPTGEFEQVIDLMAILQYRQDVQRRTNLPADGTVSDRA